MEWSCLIIYRKLVCSIWWLWSFVQSISGERQLVKLFRSEWKKLAFSTLVPVRVLSRPILWEISMTEVMLVTYVGENVCWWRIFWMLVELYVGEIFSVCWWKYQHTIIYVFTNIHFSSRPQSSPKIFTGHNLAKLFPSFRLYRHHWLRILWSWPRGSWVLLFISWVFGFTRNYFTSVTDIFERNCQCIQNGSSKENDRTFSLSWLW